MTTRVSGLSIRCFGMAAPSLSNIAVSPMPSNAVVALAAARPPDRQRLIDALDASRTEVTVVVVAEDGLSGAGDVVADVVAYVGDPFNADDAAQVRLLREALPGIAILLVVPGVHVAVPVVRRALSIGADGVVLERDLGRTLTAAVLALASGLLAVPRAAHGALQRPQLTYREKQVLTMAISGHTNAEISARLYLAQSTVKSHLSAAYRRLGVTSRREAAALVLDPDAGLGVSVLVDLERRRLEGSVSERRGSEGMAPNVRLVGEASPR
jgi:DNA-binding NarL/FixJ family response regulator